MTAVENHRREALRMELADLLDLDPGLLHDTARLDDDLALDSLGMMRLLAWLESHRVTIDHSGHPANVSELLSLLERGGGRPGLSIVVTNGTEPGPVGPQSFALTPRLPADPLAPVLSTHALTLTPVQPEDLRFLYGLAIHPEVSYRWRYRGAPPSLERFGESLWKQVIVQFVARRAADREPVGHLLAFGADPASSHARIGAAFLPEYAGTGQAAQGVATFLRYVFQTFPFRKLYLDIPGFNWPQVKSGEGRLFKVEGVLRGHNYYAGRYWDEYVCAVYAEQFLEGADMT